MSFWKWSRTAANNATADGSINWAGTCAATTQLLRYRRPSGQHHRRRTRAALAHRT
jgi:hypothetical protein